MAVIWFVVDEDVTNKIRDASKKIVNVIFYVTQQLSKKYLKRQFIEDCIRDWKHPLSDQSLPPNKVRQEIYIILEKVY